MPQPALYFFVCLCILVGALGTPLSQSCCFTPTSLMEQHQAETCS